MRRAARFLLLFAVIVAIAAGTFVWSIIGFRARSVIPDGVYRAKQPTASQLRRTISAHGIRSVVNLRGRNERDPWYAEETRVSAAAGVGHVDIPLETFDWPPKIEVQQLIATLTSAPRPILLHCESGMDRSGWASAVALLVSGEPLARARQQLSMRYGHVCLKECRLDEFFDLYAGWLAETRTPESAGAFRKWAAGIYAPEPYNATIEVTPDNSLQLVAGMPARFDVSVRNDSHSTWSATARSGPGIRLGARILGPFETWPRDPVAPFRVPHVAAADVFRDSTIREVKPGAEYGVEAGFVAPAKPGLYLVQFDMVDEMVHWFSDLGGPGYVARLEVR